MKMPKRARMLLGRSLAVLACGALAFAGCGGDGTQDLEYVKDKGTLVVGCTEFQPIT